MVDDYRLDKDFRWLGVFYKPSLILSYILYLHVLYQSIYYFPVPYFQKKKHMGLNCENRKTNVARYYKRTY